MIKKLIFKINTQYKSIEDFIEYFNKKKNTIYNDINSKLQLISLNLSSIKLSCNYKNIIEINYLENKVRFKPLYLILKYKIVNNNSLIELLLQEIITKYIIIIRSSSDTDNIVNDYISIKKECKYYIDKLNKIKKEKKRKMGKRGKKRIKFKRIKKFKRTERIYIYSNPKKIKLKTKNKNLPKKKNKLSKKNNTDKQLLILSKQFINQRNKLPKKK